MRDVRFSLWHMLLVVALVVAIDINLLAGIQALVPQWSAPWLLPLLAFVAIDAVVTQRIVARERLSFAEQGTLRTVEAMLLIVLIRAVSVVAEDVPLRDVVQPWLRDPLAFFGGQFGAYFVASFFTWALASSLASAVLHLEPELPRSGVRGPPNEEAAALQDRAFILARFDRYWLVWTLLALVGAGIALYRVPLVVALTSWQTALPLVGVLVCVLAGLLLHSQGQFDYLRYGWHLEQATVDAEVSRRWRRTGTLLVVLAGVIGLLFGSLIVFVPPPPLIPIVNFILIGMTLVLALMLALFGLLLLPFAWLLSLLTGNAAPSLPMGITPIQPPQIAQTPTERPLLPGLIFWGCITLLVGLAAIRYVQQRQDLRALVGRWPGVQRLLRFFGGWWTDVREWSVVAVQAVRERLRPRVRPSVRRRNVPTSGAQAQLRVLYRRLVRAGQRRGVPHSPAQTPHEYRAALGNALPPVEADASGLTDVYVAAEYGPAAPQPSDVRRARTYWRRLERLFARTRKPRDMSPD